MKTYRFSWSRFIAMVKKEFIQMRRDKLTFSMLIGIPLMQLILFGYAINTNPKHLPTAVLAQDYSPYTRAFIQGLKNTDYFTVTHEVKSEQEAQNLIAQNKVLFLFSIPSDFTYRLLRNENPTILVEADATDAVATSSALSAAQSMAQTIFAKTAKGVVNYLNSTPFNFNLITHAKYNPESISQYSIVPGLLGVVLTMTLVVITSLAITRERERGTMENLLATPVQPLEVMMGKIIPYIIVGYLQAFLILIAARFLFHVPNEGNIILLITATLPFIIANLAIGLTFSSIAKNQLQGIQMGFFFFLPSILLSGFMFPFKGMPNWAQILGETLPLTHFLRIVRGILLKGNGTIDIWPDIWPILIFTIVALTIGLRKYHSTLD